ncbi:glucosamine-6-phosphate deaminase [Corynebacterium suedekumii]|nr:glucosamine-6-phosphate deaminase [Corynebacterium suedekumii]
MATYRELIRRHNAGEVSFADCRAFLLDEYIGLPRDHEQSYHRTIRREFTSHVDIPDEAVHGPDPEQGGQAYEDAITAAGGVDIQLLGVGTNGHVGFNEPGSSLASRTRLKTLHPQTVADNARFFDSADEVPIHVLTQGLGTIRRARHLLLLATGEAQGGRGAQARRGAGHRLLPGIGAPAARVRHRHRRRGRRLPPPRPRVLPIHRGPPAPPLDWAP